jgi:hypothetical protein
MLLADFFADSTLWRLTDESFLLETFYTADKSFYLPCDQFSFDPTAPSGD